MLKDLVPILENLGFATSLLSPTSTALTAVYKTLRLTIVPNRIFSRFTLENSPHLPAKFPGFLDAIYNKVNFPTIVAGMVDRYDRICAIYEETMKMDKEIESNRERMTVLGLIDKSEATGVVNHAKNLYHGTDHDNMFTKPLKETQTVITSKVLAAFGSGSNKSKPNFKVESAGKAYNLPSKKSGMLNVKERQQKLADHHDKEMRKCRDKAKSCEAKSKEKSHHEGMAKYHEHMRSHYEAGGEV